MNPLLRRFIARQQVQHVTAQCESSSRRWSSLSSRYAQSRSSRVATHHGSGRRHLPCSRQSRYDAENGPSTSRSQSVRRATNPDRCDAMYSPDHIGHRGSTHCLVARASAHPTWRAAPSCASAGDSDAMLLLDGRVGIDMFAELGDAPRAMRIAGDQAVDQLLDAARTTAHVLYPLPAFQLPETLKRSKRLRSPPRHTPRRRP